MGRNLVVNSHQSLLKTSTDVSAPGVDTAATVTYAAYPGAVGSAPVGNQPVPAGYPVPAAVSHVISGILCTCDCAAVPATSPKVQIKDGTTVVFESFLPPVYESKTDATGTITYMLQVIFPLPIRNTAGNAMSVTMAAFGANTYNRVNVLNHWTEIA